MLARRVVDGDGTSLRLSGKPLAIKVRKLDDRKFGWSSDHSTRANLHPAARSLIGGELVEFGDKTSPNHHLHQLTVLWVSWRP